MSGIFDIPGYNYASSRYKIDAKNHPEQATTGSETLPQTLYDNWQLVKSIPTMTGDFMWTGYDYLGESGIGTIQYKDKKTKQNADPGLIISGGAGIIDICGKNVRKLDGARSSGDYRKLQQLVLTLIPAHRLFPVSFYVACHRYGGKLVMGRLRREKSFCGCNNLLRCRQNRTSCQWKKAQVKRNRKRYCKIQENSI